MTVIAWDGKTLAADRRGRMEYNHIFEKMKLLRVDDCLVGFSGETALGGAMEKWLRDGRNPETYPKGAGPNNCMLIVHPSGLIEQFEGLAFPIKIEGTQHAIGSGHAYARAAMFLGHDAIRAVDVACQFDSSCGNGIDSMTFSDGDAA